MTDLAEEPVRRKGYNAGRAKILVGRLQTAFGFPVAIGLIWGVAQTTSKHGSYWAAALFFVTCIAIVELIPIPAWQTVSFSLSLPIIIAVATLYSPAVAGAITWLGSCDTREFRREISVRRAVWNRSQAALAIVAAAWIFGLIATPTDPWWRLLVGTLAATAVAYAINSTLVAIHAAIEHGMTVPQVLIKMHGTNPGEFLVSYIGLTMLGAVIARFFIDEGAWSVAVFLAPLVFARQMFFQSRFLADRLADQNELLAQQASRLEELLRKEHQTVDELRELNRMKGEFVAVVSHELRTPLTALIGYAKTLQQPGFSDDTSMREEFLERMERQGDRLLRLVENLLTASKLESEELQVTISRVPFEDLVREIMEGLGSEAPRISINVPDDLPVLHTDRDLLGRVLSNLLENALKYSLKGSPCELDARIQDGHIVFIVTDHGIGIDPEKLERIFDRFYQVDSSITRPFAGAGLGLSMVRDLLDHLGGTIVVESTPGKGSRFTVTLPVSAPRRPSFTT